MATYLRGGKRDRNVINAHNKTGSGILPDPVHYEKENC
jgi:hypothetical protein